MTMDPSLHVAPASGYLGAVVADLDLRVDLGPDTVNQLRELLRERLALFFPDQHLSPDEQLAFASQFGRVQPHPDRAEWVEGTDQKVVIVSPKGGVSSVWHCDYDEDFVPCAYSTLNMVMCADDGGGDTVFCSSQLIYDNLSENFRAFLRTLTAVHQNIGNTGRRRDVAEFPLVWLNPSTGRECLLYSSHHVVRFAELSQAESDLVIQHLKILTTRPEYCYRHHWSEGTIALWDNRAIQHYAVPDFAGDRMLYQVTLDA